MEIKQNETNITFEIKKNEREYSFVVPTNSPFNEIFDVLFECVNKTNEFVIEARLKDALEKANKPAETEEVKAEVVE